MLTQFIKKTVITFGIMASALVLPHQANASSTLDIFGIQVIEGELAFAVYTAIKGDESPVRELCNPNDRQCDSGVRSYMKEVDQLSCMKDSTSVYCFVSGKSGTMPSDIGGTSVKSRLYEMLDTRALPLGVDANGNGAPTGYVKTVANIDCQRIVKTGEFSCNIRFRQ